MTDSLPARPLFLIGYRATGKSSAGRMLAAELDLPFYDMDEMIQEKAGKTVREIVGEAGWEGFRAIEREVLQGLLDAGRPSVTACGGGAVLHAGLFRKAGDAINVVWLDADIEAIMQRLATDPATGELRPALKNGLAAEDEVRAVLEERLPLYRELSHYRIDTAKNSLRETVTAIKKWLEKGV